MAARSRRGSPPCLRPGFLVVWARAQPSHLGGYRTLRPRAGALAASGVARRAVRARCGVTVSGSGKRLAQVRRGFETVAPWLLGRHADADPRTNRDLGHSYPGPQVEQRGLDREAVLIARDAERLAQPSG